MHPTYTAINSQYAVQLTRPSWGGQGGVDSARYFAPPTFISRDPLLDEKPWLSPYHYCSNNPINRVAPTGMFDKEKSAKRAQERAIRRVERIYGKDAVKDRVGDVVYDEKTKEWGFDLYINNETVIKDGGWGIKPIYSRVNTNKDNTLNLMEYDQIRKIGGNTMPLYYLISAQKSKGLESFKYLLNYIGTKTITEEKFVKKAEPALEIYGQALGNMTPIAWCGNLYYSIFKGSKDIWGNDVNAVGWLNYGIGNPSNYSLPFISFLIDIANGTYLYYKNDK